MGNKIVTLEKNWQEVFLDQLRLVPNVTLACDKAEITRQTAYRHRQESESFAAAWESALDEAVERLEYEMHRRAYEGTDKPIIYQGDVTGTFKEYSDTLAIFLAKAHRPEKYRERSEIKSDVDLNINVRFNDDLGD